MDAYQATSHPTRFTSLYPRFETSVLALNQVAKEYATVQMPAAEDFLFRIKWTQCTSELRANRHETRIKELSSNQYN